MMVNQLFKKAMAHLLIVLMLVTAISTGLTAFGVVGPQEVRAANLSEIQKGNTVIMGFDPRDFGYTGTNEWLVISVDSENKKVLVTSKYLWKGNGSDATAGVVFNNDKSSSTANQWDGSDAQEWCNGIYNTVLKGAQNEAVLPTIIDTNANYVFFMSEAEANGTQGRYSGDSDFSNYWLRDKDTSNSQKAKFIMKNGTVYSFTVDTGMGARPSFYLDISDDICATKTGNGVLSTWTINANKVHHDWNDGVETTPATTTSEGVKTYTCLTDSTHTKTETIPIIEDTTPQITSLNYNKTEFGEEGGTVEVSIEGNNLDGLTKNDFEIALKEYGDWNPQTYAVPLTYTATDKTTASLTFALPANNETAEKEYRLTAKTGADSVENKAQILKVAGAVKPEMTEITYNKKSFESAGGEVVATVTGSNLNKLTDSKFKLQVYESSEYGAYWTASNVATSLEVTDNSNATLKFTLPANNTTEDVKYRLRVVKGGSEYNPTYYPATELPGAEEEIVVENPAKENVENAIKAANDAVTEAEDAANDTKTAMEVADSSKAAAETAAKTPGEDAVKATEKAEEDAVKAQEAAQTAVDKAQIAVDKAQAAVDVANTYGDESLKTTAQTAKSNADRALQDANAAKSAADEAVTNAKAASEAAKKAASDNGNQSTNNSAVDEKAKGIVEVTISSGTVNAQTIDAAIKTAGGSDAYVTTLVIGKKVKKLSKGSFKNYKNIKTLVVKSKKLKKKTVKGSLKNSSITKVKVKVGSKKLNKKYVKKYKKIFTKKNAGKKVKVSR